MNCYSFQEKIAPADYQLQIRFLIVLYASPSAALPCSETFPAFGPMSVMGEKREKSNTSVSLGIACDAP